jgi:VWFA-related protein
LWAATPALPSRQSDDEAPRFISFTVKDRHGIYVRDLRREEVALELDGKPVEIKYLGGKDVQTSAVILLENSPRTAKQPVSIPQWGQINPIDRIRYLLLDDFFPPITANGEVLLAQLYMDFEILKDFTGDDSGLVTALQDMQLNFAGVVFNNIQIGRALGRAVNLLERRPSRRKFLVAFTAAIDRDSYQNLEEYQEMFRRSDIDLYTVAFAPRFATGTTHTFEEKMTGQYYRTLAGETGGRAYLVGEYAYLDELFTDLKGRISNAYTAGFYPPAGGPEFEVTIRVARERCTVTHRKRLVAR